MSWKNLLHLFSFWPSFSSLGPAVLSYPILLQLPLAGHSGNNHQSKGCGMEETGWERNPCPTYYLPWRPLSNSTCHLQPLIKSTWAYTYSSWLSARADKQAHGDQLRHIVHTGHWKHIHNHVNTTNGIHVQCLTTITFQIKLHIWYKHINREYSCTLFKPCPYCCSNSNNNL